MARFVQRPPPHLMVALLVIVTVAGLGLADGGFRPVTWGLAALALLWLLAVGLVVVTRVELGPLDLVVLLGLAGLVAWTAASTLWSLDRAQSVSEVQRDLVPLASLATLLLVARRNAAGAVLLGIFAACTFVSTVALTHWFSDGARMGAEIAEPVGYPNALGLLSAMGLIIALGFLRNTPKGLAGSVPTVGAAWLLSVTVSLTGSRGALAALVAGLAISLTLASRHPKRVASAVVAIATAGVIAVLAVGLVTQTRSSDATIARASPAGSIASAPATSVEPRLRFWAVALRSVAQRPLSGNGAGSFARIWLRDRPVPAQAHNTHNLYLETVTELGIVGFVLLLAALATPLKAAYHTRTHPLAPAAAGAYTAFLVHAGIDIDWEMPVVTVAGLLCGGALLMMARPAQTGHRLLPPVRVSVIAAAIALGAIAYAGVLGNATLQRANELAQVGAISSASIQARTALRRAPWSAEPWYLLGQEALARGDVELARARFARGLARDPQSWPLWAGMTESSRGAVRQDAARHATALNPFGLP